VDTQPVQYTAWNPDYLAGNQEEGVLDYTNEYSFDVAQSAISYDAVFGSIGGFETVFSDMLGNKLYYVLISNSATTKDDLIKSFNVGLTYVNKEHRVNYGYGAFHLYDEHYDDYDGFTTERQTGLEGLVSYPLSKFTRVETSAFVRHSYKNFTLFDRSRNAILSTNYVSLVHDNSLWDVSGPIDGIRYNTTVGLTTDFYTGKFFNRLAFVDLRNYLRIRKYSAFATRAFGFVSSGSEPYRIYLGGSWSLRGYDRRAFYARKVLFMSNELRFPLIDNLFIGFPFGRIGFQAIRGALFFDTGSAWNDEFDRFVGSFGAGARVALGYLTVLRFDLSKTTDYRTINPGLKFDFFFGWNF
jgi:outer membrane protein assembly factor BamA